MNPTPKTAKKKFAITIPDIKSASAEEKVKRAIKKKTVETIEIPDNANKSTILQSISSALEHKGISNEAGKHQDVINISEGYKKKIYISHPLSKPHPHCYFCRQAIDTHPIGNPVRVEKKKYIIEGVFCSFNCLLSYQQEQNSVRYRESAIHLHMLYRDMTGKRLDIIPSKSWKLLQDYGGNLTISDWRKLVLPFVTLKDEDEIQAYKDRVTESSEIFVTD